MTLLNLVIMLAFLATVVALGSGIWSMVHGGKFDAEHSEQLMYARIGFQGLTLVLLLMAGLISYSALLV